ncbi:MAG: PhoU domain-containing protein [candidate division WOR-3 bacterium]
MLLTDLLKFWKKTTLLDKASEECVEMLRTGQRMFEYSLRVLLDSGCETDDIYAMDRSLNQGEISVRRMIVEHLAVNPEQDAVAALFLASIVGDIERIGDYCKNLMELAHHYPEKLEGQYIDRIRDIQQTVGQMFADTIKAFSETDARLAQSVMERHAELARTCDALIDKLLADTTKCGRDAVIRALLIRFLKRVSAHLKNVCSSLVNPYHKLGYKPDGTPDDRDE